MIDVDELPDLKCNVEHGKLKKPTTQAEHRVESVEGEFAMDTAAMPKEGFNGS